MNMISNLEARINNIHAHTVNVDQNATSEYKGKTSTAQYMVKIDGMVKSTLANFDDFIQLFHYDFNVSRFTNPNVGHQQYSSSQVEFKNPMLVIPNGAHTPNIISRLIKGILIEEITIIRLQNIGQVNDKGEKITFKNCYFQEVMPKYDVLYVTFRFDEYNHQTTEFTQNGESKGQNALSYNMSTSDVTSSGGDSSGGDDSGGDTN